MPELLPHRKALAGEESVCCLVHSLTVATEGEEVRPETQLLNFFEGKRNNLSPSVLTYSQQHRPMSWSWFIRRSPLSGLMGLRGRFSSGNSMSIEDSGMYFEAIQPELVTHEFLRLQLQSAPRLFFVCPSSTQYHPFFSSKSRHMLLRPVFE